jgi:hypothetical protein
MYTFDGQLIPSLELIPRDCKIILVSEKSIDEADFGEDGLEKAFVTGVDPKFVAQVQLPHNNALLGLKNNIYQFNTGQEVKNYKSSKIEKSIINKKKDWITTNTSNWIKATPLIYDFHREADAKLHM